MQNIVNRYFTTRICANTERPPSPHWAGYGTHRATIAATCMQIYRGICKVSMEMAATSIAMWWDSPYYMQMRVQCVSVQYTQTNNLRTRTCVLLHTHSVLVYTLTRTCVLTHTRTQIRTNAYSIRRTCRTCVLTHMRTNSLTYSDTHTPSI